MRMNPSHSSSLSLRKKFSGLVVLILSALILVSAAARSDAQVLTPFDRAGFALGEPTLYLMPGMTPMAVANTTEVANQNEAKTEQQAQPQNPFIEQPAQQLPNTQIVVMPQQSHEEPLNQFVIQPSQQLQQQPTGRVASAPMFQVPVIQEPDQPKIFGYDLFEKSFVMGVGNVVIDDAYRVGAGDMFQVMIWGSEEASFTTQITSAGEFLMPRFGSARVQGLNFAQMKIALNEVVGKRLTGFEMSVVPIKPRRNNIFVVGEVNNPGAYELDGTATTLSALFSAGGPSRQGSLRKIEVRRGKKMVGSFDVYEFLTRGDRSGDVNLLEGDTVFVPLAGPKISVLGAVRRPFIYELKKEELTIGEALKIAGGINGLADLKKIQVRRLQPHSGQIVFSREISRTDGKFEGNATPIQDLDEIKVFAISPRNLEMVSLEGHVFEPGIRPWRQGLMLSEILKSPEMLKREPALEYGEVLREGGAGGEYEVLSFNPRRVLNRDKGFDVELQPKDRIVIFPASLMRDQAKVSINGHVVNPGTMSFTTGMRIKDLVYRSGGLKQGASLTAAELSRRTIVDGRLALDRLEFDLGKVMNDDPVQNIVLQPFDSLMVRSVPDWRVDSFIILGGEFKYPGRYSFQPGERLSAVIKRAGGFGDKAYIKAAVLTRENVKKAQSEARGRKFEQIKQDQQINTNNSKYMIGSYASEKVAREFAVGQYEELLAILEKSQAEGRVIVKLDALDKFAGSKYDVVLEPGDELFIPAKPSSVMVEGAVFNSMGVLWEVNRSIRHYLNVVGGISKNGDMGNTYLIRADGTVISRVSSGGNFIDSTTVEPGDIILVPAKIRVPVDTWQRRMDIAKVLSNLVLTALSIDRYGR